VKAHIHTVGGLSAHADAEDLIRWVRNFNNRPDVLVVHGEDDSKQAFREKLETELGVNADVPKPGDILEL